MNDKPPPNDTAESAPENEPDEGAPESEPAGGAAENEPSGESERELESASASDPGRDSGERKSDTQAPSILSARAALPVSLAVTIVTAFVLRYAFHADQAGEWGMFIALAGTYLPLAALTTYVLVKDGAVRSELRPHRGDLSFGAVVAALMYGAAMAGRQLFLGAESPRQWWVARIYLQLGDTSNNRMLYVGLAVMGIAALEELVWRGLVMRALRRPFGPLRAWFLSSVLYAVAHVSTLTLLAHPVAGPNPLVLAASFGGGLVWGHLYNRTGRLFPSIMAHALFTWAIVDFPLWRPLG